MSDESRGLASLFSSKSSSRQSTEGASSQTRHSKEGGAPLYNSAGINHEEHGGQGAHPYRKNTISGELSENAQLVMKDTRRELGNDYRLQQIQQQGGSLSESDIAGAVDRVIQRKNISLPDVERAQLIVQLQRDITGWGILQPLIDDPRVTDIHVYDYKTVVLQRGKVSETTSLAWQSNSSYLAFIDRLLLKVGKTLTTQQHTIDAALNNGVRLCAVHESVCGQKGPLLSIRIPRMSEVSIEMLVHHQVAPGPLVQYLAALVRSGLVTFMVAGETGTGKTTLVKCLGTQFGTNESIVAIEDTPELHFDHPYFRSLVSRPPNSEGVGEVSLQEHIKTTLRMTPTRVILGEMRTPFSAEAFLESAQTGHVGMSTIHARNARETLIRLESLLGRAQKSVPIDILRQQIALAVDVIIWMFRDRESGKPRIGEVIEVGHFVEGNIQIRPMFTYISDGSGPAWRIDSWSSFFDKVLLEAGLRLSEYPQELRFQGGAVVQTDRSNARPTSSFSTGIFRGRGETRV
jgi:pilus assembly protein CpaF